MIVLQAWCGGRINVSCTENMLGHFYPIQRDTITSTVAQVPGVGRQNVCGLKGLNLIREFDEDTDVKLKKSGPHLLTIKKRREDSGSGEKVIFIIVSWPSHITSKG